MKEIVYPTRLQEPVRNHQAYLRGNTLIVAPKPQVPSQPQPQLPTTCIPSKRDFINNPVNYDLVKTVDIDYQFYTIIETSNGERFFVQVASDTVPTEPVIGKLYYEEDVDHDSEFEGDVTAAMAIDPFFNLRYVRTGQLNIPPNPYDPYRNFLSRLPYRYDTKPVQTPRESSSITKLDGFTVSSSFPEDFAIDVDRLELRLNPDPYSFKFCRATSSEIEKYDITDDSSLRYINIIDYVNGGNELEVFSCAQIGLPTSPNHDDVSTINCVGAPSKYTFTLQDLHTLSDTSGTLQITDTGSGFTKKYLFKELDGFLSNHLAVEFVKLDFPLYHPTGYLEGNQYAIRLEKLARLLDVPEIYSHPLKIIIQMNAPDALFTNNGTNRLAFCLNLAQDSTSGLRF